MIDHSKPILVTGVAGFIGYHVSKNLLLKGFDVVGVDSVNDYYDVHLKNNRVENLLKTSKSFKFQKFDLCDSNQLKKTYSEFGASSIIHLAAQAGVRYSIDHPESYLKNNLEAFLSILETARFYKAEHLTYASTSSVYGANENFPFKETNIADHPIQFYAATKRSNELMAHSYSSMFNLPTSGLRFFTVYGPWGRPDMALFLFTKSILAGEEIEVFNNGNHVRDFTYVDDIAESIVRVHLNSSPVNASWDPKFPDPASSKYPFNIYNIGNSNPVPLMSYIKEIEKNLSKTAKLKFLPLQKGDVHTTIADASKLENFISFKPSTSIEYGVQKFIDWYFKYFRL